MAETEVAPPSTETAPKPFSVSLENLFKDVPTPPPDDSPTPPESKPPETKKPAEAKIDVPKDLLPKHEEKAETADASKSELDSIAEPDFKKDTKAKSGWDALKKQAKTWETRAQELERQIAERKAKGLDAETLETKLAEKEAKLKEYDEIVARARIEEHPEFRREFIDGRSKLMARAREIIEESGGDPKAIETALNLRGKPRVDALREVAGELDNFQSGRLGRVIDELTDLDGRAAEKREKAKESYEQLIEQNRVKDAEQAAQRTKARQYEFEETTNRLRGSLEVLKKSEGHDAWNARADRIVREAQEYCATNPHAEIEAEILARATPAYRDLFLEADKLVIERDKKIAELEGELKAIHSKSPSLSSRASGAATGEKSTRPFSEQLANAFAQ